MNSLLLYSMYEVSVEGQNNTDLFFLCFSSASGVTFIDAPSPSSSGSSENVSSAVSPATDSGLELSSQATSKEDLTDLDQVASLGLNAGMPSNEARVTENQNQPELQVHEYKFQRKVQTPSNISCGFSTLTLFLSLFLVGGNMFYFRA